MLNKLTVSVATSLLLLGASGVAMAQEIPPFLAMTPSDASAACRNRGGLTRCDFNNIILPTVGTERTIKQFGDPETGPFFRIDAAWVDDNLEPDPVFSTCSLSVYWSGDGGTRNPLRGLDFQSSTFTSFATLAATSATICNIRNISRAPSGGVTGG